MTAPRGSVIVTMVLLKLACTWAMPVWTFLAPFALTILICSTTAFGSSERFSGFFSSAGAASFFEAFLAFGAGAAAGASAVAVAAASVAGAAASGAGAGAAAAAVSGAAAVGAVSLASLLVA